MKKRIIKLVISCVFFVLDRLWHNMLKIFGTKTPGRCIVLYYHIVTKNQRSKFARQMDDVIRLSKPVAANFDGKVETETHYVAITFDDGFVSIINNALPELTKRNIHSTIFVPTGYLGKRPGWINKKDHDFNSELVVSKDQLLELKNNKSVSIGSHCVTHSNLLLLKEQEIKNELIESRQTLKEILKEDISLLSFPHGAYNQKILKWTISAGYKRIFIISPKMFFPTPTEYIVGRIRVDPTDWSLEFRLKLVGAYRWLHVAIKVKRCVYCLIRKHKI